MIRKIKKIVIFSGAIALVRAGVSGFLMNTTQNLKDTIPNWHDRFMYSSTHATASDRTYMLRLSVDSDEVLLKTINSYANLTKKEMLFLLF